MALTKEIMNDLQEKYRKILKLITDDSKLRKLDSVSEPYALKYNARTILTDLQSVLEKLLDASETNSNEFYRILGMLGFVYLYLGMISYEVDELSTSEKHFQQCKHLISNYQERPELIMISLNMYSQFGLLWSDSQPEKSKIHLELAEKLYNNFKKSGNVPVDVTDLFAYSGSCGVDITWKNFEKIHTLTLYYLAQIYGALKDTLKSAIYCHNTLQRQLEYDDYEPIDWALNAATLSQVFMEKNSFKQARHHLAASSFILQKYKKELDLVNETNEEQLSKIEIYNHRSADVARCWAKYGLLLLSKSKERLLNQINDDDDDDNVDGVEADFNKMNLNSQECNFDSLRFEKLDLIVYENQITCDYLLTIEDARMVFLNIQSWLNEAKIYYTLDNRASDHIQIILDQSQLYLYFSFFEDNPENQSKLHKRRADLLENIVAQVNPQYYLQYCRQIWWDLGVIYYEILNIKTDKLRESKDRPSPQALQKINNLVMKSINNYESFIKSVINGDLQNTDKLIEEDLEKPVLLGHFHIGALNGKYITLDKRQQLENVKRSFDEYKKINDYCTKHNKASELMQVESGICTEMVKLLPVKILQLQREIENC